MPFKRRFTNKYAGSSPENASVVRTLFDLFTERFEMNVFGINLRFFDNLNAPVLSVVIHALMSAALISMRKELVYADA